MINENPKRAARPELTRGVGPWSAIAINVANMIGTGVFLKTRVMTCNVGNAGTVIAVWIVAGLLSLAGTFSYSEIAAMMPEAGGDYVFLRRAYGRLVGFLYGWMFFAVAREGFESMVFLLATFQQNTGPLAAIGAVAGIGAAVLVGLLIYWGGVRLNLSRFFRWTAVFILIVAAGLLAGSVRAFHEAGLLNGLQQVVFDFTSTLPQDGVLGSFLAGIFGYHDMPTVAELLAYLGFLGVALPLFFFGIPSFGARTRDAV